MHDVVTTTGLVLLTLAAGTASVAAVLRLRRRAPATVSGPGPGSRGAQGDDTGGRVLIKAQRLLLWVCTLGAAALFLYQDFFVHNMWAPLQAHVDGLLLISALLGGTILFLQHPSRLPGVAPFAMPLLTLLLAWAICASAWTLYLFDIQSVWETVHLAAVYVGTLFFAVAAVAGGMFLFAQRRLRHKDLADGGPIASLERIERVIIGTSAVGFALLTVGMVMGLIEVTSGPTKLGPGWWYSPKIVLAVVVWLIYALVMNVRHATAFRGARAAWLSIAGLVLLLATMGIAVAMAKLPATDEAKPQSRKAAEPEIGERVQLVMYQATEIELLCPRRAGLLKRRSGLVCALAGKSVSPSVTVTASNSSATRAADYARGARGESRGVARGRRQSPLARPSHAAGRRSGGDRGRNTVASVRACSATAAPEQARPARVWHQRRGDLAIDLQNAHKALALRLSGEDRPCA